MPARWYAVVAHARRCSADVALDDHRALPQTRTAPVTMGPRPLRRSPAMLTAEQMRRCLMRSVSMTIFGVYVRRRRSGRVRRSQPDRLSRTDGKARRCRIARSADAGCRRHLRSIRRRCRVRQLTPRRCRWRRRVVSGVGWLTRTSAARSPPSPQAPLALIQPYLPIHRQPFGCHTTASGKKATRGQTPVAILRGRPSARPRRQDPTRTRRPLAPSRGCSEGKRSRDHGSPASPPHGLQTRQRNIATPRLLIRAFRHRDRCMPPVKTRRLGRRLRQPDRLAYLRFAAAVDRFACVCHLITCRRRCVGGRRRWCCQHTCLRYRRADDDGEVAGRCTAPAVDADDELAHAATSVVRCLKAKPAAHWAHSHAQKAHGRASSYLPSRDSVKYRESGAGRLAAARRRTDQLIIACRFADRGRRLPSNTKVRRGPWA